MVTVWSLVTGGSLTSVVVGVTVCVLEAAGVPSSVAVRLIPGRTPPPLTNVAPAAVSVTWRAIASSA